MPARRIFKRPKEAVGPCALCPDCGAIIFANASRHEQDEHSARTYGVGDCPRCGKQHSWLMEMTTGWQRLDAPLKDPVRSLGELVAGVAASGRGDRSNSPKPNTTVASWAGHHPICMTCKRKLPVGPDGSLAMDVRACDRCRKGDR